MDPTFIDAHTHLYKDLATEKRALPIPGRRDRDRWGNAESIIPFMDREGISHVVALNFYPTGLMRRALRARRGTPSDGDERPAEREIEGELAAGLRRQNDWLCGLAEAEPRIIAGIGIQKLLTPEEMVIEVERCARRGARAVKLVPGWFHEYPDDRAFWPAYERCQELGLAVTADTGMLGVGHHVSHPDEDTQIAYGEPRNFRAVLDDFPRLTLVMCHFPSAFWLQRVELAKRYGNLVFDLSGGFSASDFLPRDGDLALPEVDAVRVLREVGVDRFMFGSDGPHVMVQAGLEQVLRLELSDDEREMILSGNARRIYGIGS